MSSVTSALTSALYASAAQTGTRPDTVTADAFARWPVAAQAALVRSFGTGSPPSILVGQAGQRAIATLNETGTDVDVVQAPASLDTAPADLTREAFERWPGAAQIFYVRANGSGDPCRVDLGGTAPGGSTATLAETYGLANGVVLTDRGAPTAAEDALIKMPVAQLTSADFFTLSPDDQYAYFQKNGTSVSMPSGPAVLVLKLDTQPPNPTTRAILTLSSNGRPFAVEVQASDYPGFAGLTGSKIVQTSPVKASVFATWPREIQRAYVEGRFTGATDPDATDAFQPAFYPKVVVFTDGSKIAAVTAPGAEVEMIDIPAGFGNGTTGLAAGTFLSWSPAAQLAFAREVYNSTSLPSFTLPGSTGAQALSVTLALSRNGLTLASVGDRATNLAVDPAALDLDLFHLWPIEDRVAYIDAKGGGTPGSLLTGAGTFLLSLGPDALPRLESVPTGFTTTPAALAPATFLGWSPAIRAAYLGQSGLAGVTETTVVDAAGNSVMQRSATIGTAPGPVLTATRIPSGDVVTTGSILAIDPTRGMGLPIPNAGTYGGAGGLDRDPNASSADALFPGLDGTAGRSIENKPAKVAAQFAKAPKDLAPDEFGTWNSVIQLEYLRKHGTASQGYALVIGPGPDGATATTAFISESGTKVYTVGTLQKTDVGKMSSRDQAVLVTLDAFTKPLTGRAAALELTAGNAALLKAIDDLASAIALDPTPLKGGQTPMPLADRQVFLHQVAILKDKVAGSSIVSASSIQPQIDDLKARFERANAFATALPRKALTADPLKVEYETPALSLGEGIPPATAKISVDPDHNTKIDLSKFLTDQLGSVHPLTADSAKVINYSSPIKIKFYDGAGNQIKVSGSLNAVEISRLQAGVVQVNAPTLSTDGNQALQQCYRNLISQERQLLSLAESRASLAQTGKLAGSTQHLDVPNLVYLFQLQANLTGEAKLRADTEELNQINALVKLYGVAQNMVNRILKDNDSSGKGNISPSGGMTREEKEAGVFFAGGAPHPIEIIYSNISHPNDGFGARPYERWGKLSTQLSERVTLINQESQIKMNSVNSSTKAKDRNFDLANNALTKMNEIVQKIAGAM